MFYVVFALLMFIVSVMTHIFFCRRQPKTNLQARAYIYISVFFIIIYILGVWLVGHEGLLQAGSWWGMPLKVAAGVMFVLLVPIYLSFYVLTQLMSPSKKILLSLAARGNLTYGQLLTCIEEEDFIGTRLNDLVTSGCVKQTEGRYVLGLPGQKIAVILNIMQRVLGRNIGG
jgi:hypothetical protein